MVEDEAYWSDNHSTIESAAEDIGEQMNELLEKHHRELKTVMSKSLSQMGHFDAKIEF